jgi:hypothetical protein
MRLRAVSCATIVLAIAPFGAVAEAQATRAARAFGYPLIPDLVADPTVVDIDGVFYCYATTDGFSAGLAASGPPVVWKSKDFLNWSFAGSLFPDGFALKYWAPSSPIRSNGRFYLFPTLNERITAVTADSPEGPFRRRDGGRVLTSADLRPFPIAVGKPIDAEVFVDDDGSPYMVWAQRGICRLKPGLDSPDGEQTLVPTKREGYSEGPFLFKRNGIYYYLYTLDGHETYHYAYMMSRTSPMGPWEAPAADIFAETDYRQGIYGPGHGSVFHPRGSAQWYFVYLEYGRSGSTRQIYADKLDFNPDGTIRPVKLTKAGVGALRPAPSPAKNLALGAAATSSSTLDEIRVKPRNFPALDRTEDFVPANAVDGSNGSRWLARDGDANPWFQVDLGRVRPIQRTEAYFVKPTAGHAYRLEISTDGRRWLAHGGHETLIRQSPHVDSAPARARFVRLTILKGTPGLWEFRVFP